MVAYLPQMTSPQKKPLYQKQRYPPVTAMTPQHPFAATVPNMIPRLAATPRENTTNRVPSIPSMDIKHHGSYPKMSSIVSRPPGNADTWLGPHFNILPHQPELPSSPAMYSDTFGLSSGLTKVNLVPYSSNTQAVSLPILVRQLQGAPSAGNAVSAAPSPPKPTGKTVSRVPSNDIPRKAPLQGKSCAGILLARSSSRKFPKPRQQPSTSQPETPTKATISVQKRRQSPIDEGPGAWVQRPIVLPETSRAQKRPRKDGDEESHEVEMVEVRRKGDDKTETQSSSTETTSCNNARNDQEKTGASVPHQRLAKKRATRATSPAQSSHRHKRAMYEYEVPLEVEGIRKALDADTWDEYVYLLESMWLQKVTAHEFEQGTQPLFHIECDAIRKRMNSVVVKKMIMPRLEEMGNNLPQRSE